MTKKLYIFLLALLPFLAGAQDAPAGPPMADTFRQEGKIYVVIAVIALIFIAILLFLVFIERRLSRLEKKVKENN